MSSAWTCNHGRAGSRAAGRVEVIPTVRALEIEMAGAGRPAPTVRRGPGIR